LKPIKVLKHLFKTQALKKEKGKELSPTTPIVEQPAPSSTHPSPERLQIDKGVEKQILLPDYDFLDELKNVYIKIVGNNTERGG